MWFAQANLLIWTALVAVPILLYLFRPRPRTVRVSTLPFFKSLIRAHQESAWLRRLKQLLSFLLSVLVILGMVGALARLVVAPPAEALKTVVVLVDRSASMDARDPEGRTRLYEALSQIRQRLAGLSGGVGVVVMAYDRRPEILLPRSLDPRAVERALDTIRMRPIEGDAPRAIELAARIAALETPATIWHATDANPPPSPTDTDSNDAKDSKSPSAVDTDAGITPFSPQARLPQGVSLDSLRVALSAPVNAGITALDLRRSPQQRTRFEAFVQVHSTVPKESPAELEVFVDGTLVEIRKLTLSAEGRERLLVPVQADTEKDSVLSVSLKFAGDTFPLDNVAHARVPKSHPLSVLWISESRDPFTELALSSLGEGHDVLVGKPDAWPPKERPDVVLFDQWLPEAWPEEIAAVVINPPKSLGPFKAVKLPSGGVPVDQVRASAPDHPVLYGVASGRVSLTQTAVMESDGGLEPLWLGPNAEPLLLAGEARGQRLVVMGFAPQQSESLQLMASYPLLIGNAIYWASEPRSQAYSGRNHRTGELVELEGDAVSWTNPLKNNPNTPPEKKPPAVPDGPVSTPIRGRWTELDRIGLWQSSGGKIGTASLLSPSETRLASSGRSLATSALGDAPTSGTQPFFRGDLASLLIWAALSLLLLESWLFHRRAVY